MANKTVDQLTAAAAALLTHEFEIYDPAGTPKSQKITGLQLIQLALQQNGQNEFDLGSLQLLGDDGSGNITVSDGGSGQPINVVSGADISLTPGGNLIVNGSPGVSGTFAIAGISTITILKGVIIAIG